MGLYDYKAVGAGNQVKEGTLDVADTAAAAQKLMMQGLRPIEIKQHTKGKRASFSLDRLRRKEITRTDIIFFTKQMALLLNAGLSLDASLRTLNQYSAKPAFKEFTGQLERKLKEGKSLSQALSDYPKHFSSMYINIVRAGEEGGVLPSMLLKINEYQAASQELRQFVISSSIYPAILMVTGIVCLLLLFTVILPRFEILFEGMDSHIAFHVRIMMDIARFVNSHLILTLIFLFGPPVLFVRYLGTEEGKRAFDRFSIRMPILSDFIRGMETSRIFRTLEVLVNNGVHLATALKISSGVAGNME
ncbi:MAG: type II secretion system F family protein, partial [Desulfobulbaceae bacterium]|nr:type II secretion system F family protein [Desulfobulbaceae bacterium]